MRGSDAVGGDYSGVFEQMVSAGVVVPGLNFKCRHCLRTAWYPLEMISRTFNCRFCLQTNDVGVIGKTNEWMYKSLGIFGIPRSIEGSISTALTLLFFERDLGQESSILLPSCLEIDGRFSEVDLVILRHTGFWWEWSWRCLICECKTERSFSKDDVSRVRRLAAKIPGAVIVLSTLRDRD